MSPTTDNAPPSGGQFDQAGDATRRTHLANERTYLAWWRTGLTALASGVAIGRVVPSLTHQTRWPYAILGAGFALLGIVAVAYGLVRQQAVRDARPVLKDASLRVRTAYRGPDPAVTVRVMSLAGLLAVSAAGSISGSQRSRQVPVPVTLAE